MSEMDDIGNNDLIEIVLKHKKSFLIIAAITITLATIITFVTPKKYSSSAVFFPPAFNSAEQTIKPQMGFVLEADRLIQMAQSSELKDSLMDRYDLAEYYNVQIDNPAWRNIVYRKLDKDLEFERTKYLSVVVKFISLDADLSANIVNEVVDMVSRFWQRMYKENAFESLEYARKQYLEKDQKVSALLDTIHSLRTGNSDVRLNKELRHLKQKEAEIDRLFTEINKIRSNGQFYNYGDQLDELQLELTKLRKQKTIDQERLKVMNNGTSSDTLKQALTARIEGSKITEKQLMERFSELQENGKRFDQLNEKLGIEIAQYQTVKTEYEQLLNSFEPNVRSLNLENLEDTYRNEKAVLNELKNLYDKSLRFYNQPMAELFVVERAKPDYIHSSPFLLLNVAFSLTGSMIFSLLYFVIRTRLKEGKSIQNN